MTTETNSHVLIKDVIISELGRCDAGTMISESDVHSGTWDWLQNQGFLKSVADIEAEADSEVPEAETAEPAVVLTPVDRQPTQTGRTGKKSVPAAG